MQNSNRLEVHLIDNAFSHLWRDDGTHSIIHEKTQNVLKYTRDESIRIKLITNNCIEDYKRKEGDKIIYWLTEPRCLIPKFYSLLEKDVLDYDILLNHDTSMQHIRNFNKIPFGGCWIKEKGSFQKNKLLSMILSEKMQTVGHCIRHHIHDELQSNFEGIDYFGLGSKFGRIQNKEQGLCSYKFSVVVENCNDDGWFTEKLVDCFRCRTVPVYWGSDTKDYFDQRGIIKIQNISDINDIVSSLNDDLYEEMLPFIETNYQKSFEYETTEQHFNLDLFRI